MPATHQVQILSRELHEEVLKGGLLLAAGAGGAQHPGLRGGGVAQRHRSLPALEHPLDHHDRRLRETPLTVAHGLQPDAAALGRVALFWAT